MLGYRPSVKTVGPARARIWGYWSVRKAERRAAAFRCLCGIGHQGHMSLAGLQLWQCVYLIGKRRFIDFALGSEDSDSTKCTAKAHPKRIWFSKMRKWALDFKWREFYFPTKRGLGGRPACWEEEKLTLYPWQIHYTMAPFKNSAILFIS